jgi:hypothetical protein
MGIHAFSKPELEELSSFDGSMFSLVLRIANFKFGAATMDCARFDNQSSAAMAGMIAVARLRNDGAAITALATGAGGAVRLPWNLQMQGAIYGDGEALRSCYPLSDAKRFSNYFQIATAAPGEVVDRFRGHINQPFGYALGSLASLMNAAKVLHDSGFDTWNYNGTKGQSMRAALHYYAFYFSTWLTLENTPVPDTKNAYPSYEQYIGQPVSRSGATVTGADGVLDPFMLALRAYGEDSQVRAVLARAESFSGKVVPLYGFDTITLPDVPLLDAMLPQLKDRETSSPGAATH